MTTFVFVVGLLVLIIVTIDFTEKNEKFVRNGVEGDLIFDYYLSFIPWIANLIAPITIFIASVLVTSTMAAKTEIVAILAGGVSFRRMMLPFFAASVLISAGTFYANGWWIPNSNKFRIQFEIEYLKKPFYFNERDIHFKVGEDLYLYLQRYNNKSNTGYKATLEKIENHQMKEKLTAKKMVWVDSIGKWRFKDFHRREVTSFGEKYCTGKELDSLLNLNPEDFKNKYQLQEAMNLDELGEYVALLKDRGADDIAIYQNEIYIRYMTPFTAVILTLMGVAVAAEKNTRGGTGFKIALGFVIAFVFIIMFVLVKAIAEAGTMNPLLAIWIPNIVGTIVTFLLYKAVPK